MSNPRKSALALAGVLILILVIWLAGDRAPSHSNPIVIGSVLGLTGDASVDALNIQRGIELARKDLSKQGVSVEIRYEDDGTDTPGKTVLATQRLVDLYHPQAFIGYTWDFNLTAAAPIINKYGIPTYSPANTSGVDGARGDSIFFGAPVNETKLEPVAAYLKQKEIHKVAIIIQESAWGENHVKVYTKAAEAAGAQVVLVEKSQYGDEATAIPTEVAKARQSGAEIVLWSGGQQGIATLLAKMQDQEFDVPLIGEVGVSDVVANGLVRKTAKADWFAFRTTPSEEFTRKFQAEYHQAPGLYADIAYDGLMVLAEAIRNTDGAPGRLAAYIRDGKVTYRGYSSTSFKVDKDGGVIGGSWYLDPVR